MSTSPFHLKAALGRTYEMTEDDVRRTKQALRSLGYFKTPDYGLTDTPDEALFGGLEAFQRQHGLKVDGIIKPDGETALKLGAELEHRDIVRRGKTSGARSGATRVAMMRRRRAGAPGFASGPYGMGGILEGGGGVGGGRGGTGKITAGRLAKWLADKFSDGEDNDKDKSSRTPVAGSSGAPPSRPADIRTPVIEQYPAEPPFEPGNKEEYPANPPKVPTVGGRPVNEVMKNDPRAFHIIDEELRKALVVYSHRGDKPTQDWNDEVVNEICPRVLRQHWGPEYLDRIEHTGGAHDAKENPKKEKYLKNIETNGKKGSSNPDITYGFSRTPGGELDGEIHLNTGRTLKDGKTGIASEERQLKNLSRNAGENIAALVPKLRPGMDRAKVVARAEEVCFDVFVEAFGPPTRAK